MDEPYYTCYYIADVIIIQYPTLDLSSIATGF